MGLAMGLTVGLATASMDSATVGLMGMTTINPATIDLNAENRATVYRTPVRLVNLSAVYSADIYSSLDFLLLSDNNQAAVDLAVMNPITANGTRPAMTLLFLYLESKLL